MTIRPERRSGERRLEFARGATRWDMLIAVVQDDRALCGLAFLMGLAALLLTSLHITGVLPGVEKAAYAIESTTTNSTTEAPK